MVFSRSVSGKEEANENQGLKAVLFLCPEPPRNMSSFYLPRFSFFMFFFFNFLKILCMHVCVCIYTLSRIVWFLAGVIEEHVFTPSSGSRAHSILFVVFVCLFVFSFQGYTCGMWKF